MIASAPAGVIGARFTALSEWAADTRWRTRASAFALGALSILSMAPFFLWPVLWLTLPGLLALLRIAEAASPACGRWTRWRSSALGRAAETGWWFGFGYHVFGLFWVVEAFLVEAETFAWLIPLTLALPAGLALFTAATTAFAAAVAPARTFDRVVALALGFGVTEWLRGHILTGLPWNVLGYALTPPGMMQGAAYVGIYGLTIATVLMFAGPIVVWRQHRQRAAAIALALVLPVLAPILSLLAAFEYEPPVPLRAQPPFVRIVQPSILQREKWQPENQRRIFDEHLALSLTAPDGTIDGARNIALIVWPEAAMPFVPLAQPIALFDIGRMLPENTTLLSGALRIDPAAPNQERRVYNTLLGFRRGEPAAHMATYDKTHLVPFGEYLPLQRLLEAMGLQQLSKLRGGFASGTEPRPLIDVPGVGRLAPLICYESIFPARVVQTVERPRALVVVTNDGWFGNTTGPRQHFHMARVRAVEEGLPVIRSANNGISAIIDPLGRVVARLDLNVRGTIDASLPLRTSPPPYSRVGDIPFALVLLALALGLGLRYRQRHVKESF